MPSTNESSAVLTNRDIVVFAVALLEGAAKKVSTEDIAVKAYALAPDRFSWVLPQYRSNSWPDKEAVRNALEDAKKLKYGALVAGKHNRDQSKDGWRLTAAGSAWFLENEDRVKALEPTVRSRMRRQDSQRFYKLKLEPLFKKFVRNHKLIDASKYELTDLLVCSPDAPSDMIRLKFDTLHSTAQLAGDKQILDFIVACESRFSDILGAKS